MKKGLLITLLIIVVVSATTASATDCLMASQIYAEEKVFDVKCASEDIEICGAEIVMEGKAVYSTMYVFKRKGSNSISFTAGFEWTVKENEYIGSEKVLSYISFTAKRGNRLFPCRIGVGHCTLPDLHGREWEILPYLVVGETIDIEGHLEDGGVVYPDWIKIGDKIFRKEIFQISG